MRTMELTLEPVVPMLRKCRDGRMRFNRGYRSPMKGKTLEELYGEERAREIRMKMSEKQKGHPNYFSGGANAKPCVAIHGGRLVARFASGRDAAACMGVTANSVCRWLKGTQKPGNGWLWFYEEDSRMWGEMLGEGDVMPAP